MYGTSTVQICPKNANDIIYYLASNKKFIYLFLLFLISHNETILCNRRSLTKVSKQNRIRVRSGRQFSSLQMAGIVGTSTRAVGKLAPKTTALLLCDIQDRFRPLIYRAETVIRSAQYLTSVAKELSVPIVGTQQYTKVFGPTVSDCFAGAYDHVPIFEKKLFSMLTPEVKSHLDELNKDSFILVGIEAHVCVQQTCLDLLEVRSYL